MPNTFKQKVMNSHPGLFMTVWAEVDFYVEKYVTLVVQTVLDTFFTVTLSVSFG